MTAVDTRSVIVTAPWLRYTGSIDELPFDARRALFARVSESAAVVSELAKIAKAGEAIRSLGMRFNAGHALNYFNVQPVAALPGVRELHIGHAIVSRALFVGMREAVREMKALMVRAAR